MRNRTERLSEILDWKTLGAVIIILFFKIFKVSSTLCARFAKFFYLFEKFDFKHKKLILFIKFV